MNNIPVIKVGIVGVSRDCFPAELTQRRRKALVEAYTAKYGAADIYECPVTIIESEIDMVNALADIKAAGCTILVNGFIKAAEKALLPPQLNVAG